MELIRRKKLQLISKDSLKKTQVLINSDCLRSFLITVVVNPPSLSSILKITFVTNRKYYL